MIWGKDMITIKNLINKADMILRAQLFQQKQLEDMTNSTATMADRMKETLTLIEKNGKLTLLAIYDGGEYEGCCADCKCKCGKK